MKRILFPVLMALSMHVFSQESLATLENANLRVNLIAPSVVYEMRLNNNTSLFTETSTAFVASRSYTIVGDTYTNFALSAIISGEYRWYYNLLRREKKGKKISGNSANHFSAVIRYQSNSFVSENASIESMTIVGGQWGYQRQFWKHFIFECKIGAGYYQSYYGRQGFIPLVGMRLGAILWRKKD